MKYLGGYSWYSNPNDQAFTCWIGEEHLYSTTSAVFDRKRVTPTRFKDKLLQRLQAWRPTMTASNVDEIPVVKKPLVAVHGGPWFFFILEVPEPGELLKQTDADIAGIANPEPIREYQRPVESPFRHKIEPFTHLFGWPSLNDGD